MKSLKKFCKNLNNFKQTHQIFKKYQLKKEWYFQFILEVQRLKDMH